MFDKTERSSFKYWFAHRCTSLAFLALEVPQEE